MPRGLPLPQPTTTMVSLRSKLYYPALYMMSTKVPLADEVRYWNLVANEAKLEEHWAL
jgi:hypothetical protein